jgi:UDP-glucose-4-epimerase GalE
VPGGHGNQEAGLGNVLVTGGAGYIGSHASLALVREGHRVVVFDDLSAGHRDAVDAIAGVAPGRISLVVGDIRDTDAVRAALRESAATAVMHFAAWLSVGDSVRDPAGYYRNNVNGALAVLEAMAAERVRTFVFSSTCATYGDPVETPMGETHPQRPVNAYGETKLAIERALPHYERAYGLRWVALRYFNAAGADPGGLLGEDHSPEIHIIPRAIAAALGRDSLQVFGDDYGTPDGTCLRDYIHVTDLADAHLRALDHLEAGGESSAFNVGTGVPSSVLEVIRVVERVSGRPVAYTVGPRREGDPPALFAANTRIRERLGWAPRLAGLDAIVDTAWRWHTARPQGYSGDAR